MIKYIKCYVDIMKSDHKQASSSVISEFIKPKLLDPKIQYGISNIIQDVKQKFGVTWARKKHGEQEWKPWIIWGSSKVCHATSMHWKIKTQDQLQE